MPSCRYGIDILGTTICFDIIVDPIVNNIVNPMQQFFSNLYNQISSDLGNAINTVITGLKNFFEPIFNDIKSTIGNVFHTIAQHIESGLGIVKDIFGSIASHILQHLEDVAHTIQSVFSGIISNIEQGINDAKQTIVSTVNTIGTIVISHVESGVNTVQGFFGGIFNTILSEVRNGVQTYIKVSQDVLNAVQKFVGEKLQDAQKTLGDIGKKLTDGFHSIQVQFGSVIGDIGNAIGGALKTIGNELYNTLKPIAEQILSGIESIGNSIVQFFANIPHMLINLLKNYSREAPLEVIIRLITFVVSAIGTYIAITSSVKVVENLHPIHNLEIEEFTDKVFEFLGFADIINIVQKGIIGYGFGKQMEYAMNYIARPKVADINIETLAFWAGLESEEELRKGFALEGYSDDLIDKAIKTIYRPISPYLLRHFLETGLIDSDFLIKQLRQSGFDPADIPVIVKAFDALLLVPFQNKIRNFVYDGYKSGLMSETEARAILNVFQIPKVQQDWILRIADLEFNFQERQLLVQLVLNYLSKALITVDQCIEGLTTLGMIPERAETICKIRAISASPPPPKSVRAQLLQQVLREARLAE